MKKNTETDKQKFSSLDEFMSFRSQLLRKTVPKVIPCHNDYTQIGKQLVRTACRLIEKNN